MELRSRLAVILAVATLSGCIAEADSDQQSAPAQARPLQPVDVATVLHTEVTEWHTFTTRLESPEQVELRPRISGVIDSVEFTEGSYVQKGDLLVRIDPRPFQAEVERLKAERVRATAALRQAQTEAKRAKSLQSRNAMSDEQAEARGFLVSQRHAELASVSAALQAAELNLEFTEIRAPISGRVSNAYITTGNNVQAGSSVLTTLVSTDQLHAYFDVDERTWNRQFQQVDAQSGLMAALQLSGDQGFPYQGQLDFIDNRVNPGTGTLRVRATFEATQPALRPGAFARVRMAADHARLSVVVPDRAIGTDLENQFVLTVDANNTLAYRKVSAGVRIGELRVIEQGLAKGERIAVNGPARVGPGMPIQPREVEIDRRDLSQMKLMPEASEQELSESNSAPNAQTLAKAG
ncbi:efflux RND transporter periplasmic adaptor subunit [Oceanospirillum sediminis]|uniref:Efflux RND transporter periplasmic adaptor subunit n=1 Tax=Oceanospirillum sediminis TaxID=2760088 RepID=A0A839ISE0_9GAMM|nr:efflux RND transporter periplasmic adaptor subunit [Oceanospirillum sediminis]MBB1488383.1 efflux RND transporter periplasmic adaptor subunit [Oceanospirillum sediminis]